MDYLLRMFCICARHVFQSHFKCSSCIGDTEDYAGVRRWEEAAIDTEEMNEIKDEWVF